MGQQDVYKFLVHHPGKWFYAKEIGQELGISTSSVSKSLRIMSSWGEVERIFRSGRFGPKGYQYRYKKG